MEKFEIFKNLPRELIQQILNLATEKTFPAKKVFIRQGENKTNLFLILEGLVNVYHLDENGKEMSLGILESGDIVGEMSLIDQIPRSAFVKTISEVKVLEISGESFKILLDQNPKLMLNVLALVTKKVRNNNKNIENISTNDLKTRTINTLNILRNSFPNNELNLTHEELASIVGASRARVTETLHALLSENKIKLTNSKITLLS